MTNPRPAIIIRGRKHAIRYVERPSVIDSGMVLVAYCRVGSRRYESRECPPGTAYRQVAAQDLVSRVVSDYPQARTEY